MARSSRRPDGGAETLFSQSTARTRPLAARMRPRTLEEFAGQEHLLGPGKALRVAIDRGIASSIILWGPPGSGKTTLAFIMAGLGDRVFVPFSAVSEGVPRLREVIAEARERLASGGRQTALFVDEIHRLATNQQDALLQAVEDGLVLMTGATTANPSFSVNGALLSRSRVFVLQPLGADDIAALLRRAITDEERGLGAMHVSIADDALQTMAAEADGDARRGLTVLEAAALHVGAGGEITAEIAREAMQLRFAQHDRAGESHFNILSAYHKSLRGSDPQGALYWMARMLEGGEDPLTICRRAIAMASEDIGLADPQALVQALAARDAFRMMGAPEGYLALAQMTIYLATAPKSNSAYRALHSAIEAARRSPGAPVPLHIRNAPTPLMKELGYHAGYQYAHDAADAYIPQEYLPEEVRGAEFYTPGSFGFEKEISKRLDWWRSLRERVHGEASDGGQAASGA